MSKADEARASARTGELARQGSMATGFLMGTVGYGAVRSRLPAQVMGFPTNAVLGGVSLLMGFRRRRTKRGAMWLGAGAGLTANYLTELGSSTFGGAIGNIGG